MTALLIAVVVASFLGSPHCAGMCGCFAALASRGPGRPGGGGGSGGSSGSRPVLAPGPMIAYHASRLFVYAAAGAAAGLVGAALDLGGSLVGLQRVAAVGAGGLLVAIGLVSLLRLMGVRVPLVGTPETVRGAARAGHRFALRFGPMPRAAAVGALSVLLPCGWLYAFLVTAAGTGSAAYGAAVMAAFWVGTVPILAVLGLGVQGLAAYGRRLQLATSLVVIVVGLWMSVSRASAPPLLLADNLARPPESVTDATERARDLDPEAMPCCHE